MLLVSALPCTVSRIQPAGWWAGGGGGPCGTDMVGSVCPPGARGPGTSYELVARRPVHDVVLRVLLGVIRVVVGGAGSYDVPRRVMTSTRAAPAIA